MKNFLVNCVIAIVIIGYGLSIIIPPLMAVILPILMGICILVLIVGGVAGIKVVFFDPIASCFTKKAPPVKPRRQRPPP